MTDQTKQVIAAWNRRTDRCGKCGHFAQSYADCPLAPPYSDGCPHLSGEKKKP
jgi:hypothetical protein